MSSNPVKYEVLIKQYLRSILDISGIRSPIYIPKDQNLKVHVNYVQGSLRGVIRLRVFAKEVYHDSFWLSLKRLFALKRRYDSSKELRSKRSQDFQLQFTRIATTSKRTSYNFC